MPGQRRVPFLAGPLRDKRVLLLAAGGHPAAALQLAALRGCRFEAGGARALVLQIDDATAAAVGRQRG